MSISRDDRRTPRFFFEACVRRYGPFDLDAAANAENHLCEEWFGPGGIREDGLDGSWLDPLPAGRVLTVWLNPPYGPSGVIPWWIAKARHERDLHWVRTLMLLPADTSTKWFHDVWKTELCELVPFRLAFGNGSPDNTESAKFGSLLVWIAPQITRKGR